MNIFLLAFQEILYRPILNLLVFFYNLPIVDFGIAIIILTILIRLILWPLNSKSITSQRETQIKTQLLQEKMKEIKKKYKNDPNRQNEEMMKLWKENKFNPFASFLPMIIQLIIVIALYQVLQNVLAPNGLDLLYGFVPRPEEIDPAFLGILDLSQKSWIVAILAGVSQYFSSKMIFSFQKESQDKKLKKENKKKAKESSEEDRTEEMQKKMQKMMESQTTYFLPALTIFIGAALPSALPLYWLVSTLLGIIQQKLIYKKKS
ncbi:MAG TPA: YidC/Oxa1 family membrane protein insertase [Candidatus Pacearchaeota archaeon]|nr:YidC/Oxa1 family membrane protein insertase [Candidatus Pacearchaeota archaeon]HQD89357.1 YidC/Oxa1 family membrane protein insertase [Candidatus Pacearchaeota archaeon]